VESFDAIGITLKEDRLPKPRPDRVRLRERLLPHAIGDVDSSLAHEGMHGSLSRQTLHVPQRGNRARVARRQRN
jgi:hypothetical protein